ncbi:putative small s protein [Botrytis fragariae]|uniref:Putative small s protein n=1 Tax=Botrytis fragariae TaxID=1964551 RepID=A0A8H6AN40_9HELO|nr:putative small s protein [Botrytis fragariae]KAF5870522.1 putative small s protein [Botrytis fragariae]
MMNPLDALSLAGTIIQFVDFSSKVLAGTNELYKSGAEALAVHQQLGLVADDLTKMSKRLSDSYWGLSGTGTGVISTPSDDAFMFICRDASELSIELNNKLNNLKVTVIGKRRKWETIMQALKSVWTEKELTALTNRLTLLRDSIQMHVVVDLRDQLKSISSSQEVGFDRLDTSTKTIVTALLIHQDEVSKGIQDQTIAITQLLGRMEILAEKRTYPPGIVQQIDKIEVNHQDCLLSAKDFQPASLLEYLNLPECLIGSEHSLIRLCIRSQTLILAGEQTSQSRVLHNPESNEKALRLQITQYLVQNLKFPALKEREETIADVYRGTFEWLFNDSHESTPWPNFIRWLEHGSSIYWINGKAASGKSTLMRFICEHSKTKELLEKWSAPLPIVMAKFYFWNSGTLVQRSLSGLLRALLSQILGHLPDLIPVCFPQRWAKIYNDSVRPFSGVHPKFHSMEMDYWSLTELQAAMRSLVSQTVQHFKLCLFVDGLDEYEGEPSAITKYFKMLAQVPWLKICVSSRPLLGFDDAFGSGPTLRLQDLTRIDINHYVKSSLQENVNYQRLCVEQPIEALALIRNVVSRADGVFLWVRLVLQEIVRGLDNRDSLQELQERMEIVPQDLEELFSSMLGKIEPFYSKKAASIFLVVRAANVHQRSVKSLDTLILSFALDHGTSRFADINFNFQDLEMRNKEISDHLKVRCAGLLETGPKYSPGFEYLGYRVAYLHRSVREYLERSDIHQKFLKDGTGRSFEPQTALMCSYIKELQISEPRKNTLNQPSGLPLFVATVLHFAHDADIAGSDAYVEPLDKFATLTHSARSKSIIWAPAKFSSFLHIATKWDLCAYVRVILGRLASEKKGIVAHTLLAYALAGTDEYYLHGMEQMENSDFRRDRFPPSNRMIGLLLEHGAHPNKKLKDFPVLYEWTAFEIAIRNVCAILPPGDTEESENRQYSEEEKPFVSNHLTIVKLMLDNGADANTTLNYQGRTITSRKLLTETMGKYWRSKEWTVDEMFRIKGGKLEPSMIRKWIMTRRKY